jgi:hypothetical protein
MTKSGRGVSKIDAVESFWLSPLQGLMGIDPLFMGLRPMLMLKPFQGYLDSFPII